MTLATASDTSGNICRATGVEEHRLVAVDQVLVEGEATGSGLLDARRQAVDAVGDLVDVGLHAPIVRSPADWGTSGARPPIKGWAPPGGCGPARPARGGCATAMRLNRLDRCRSTVLGDRNSSAAISLLVRPATTSLRTSTSRLVTPSARSDGGTSESPRPSAGHRCPGLAEHRAAAASQLVVATARRRTPPTRAASGRGRPTRRGGRPARRASTWLWIMPRPNGWASSSLVGGREPRRRRLAVALPTEGDGLDELRGTDVVRPTRCERRPRRTRPAPRRRGRRRRWCGAAPRGSRPG